MRHFKKAAALGLAFLMTFTALPTEAYASGSVETESVQEKNTESQEESTENTEAAAQSETAGEQAGGTQTEPETAATLPGQGGQPETSAQSESYTEQESDANSLSKPGTETDAENTEAGTEIQTEPETESELESESESETETETESESESESEKAEEAVLEFLYAAAPEMASEAGQAVIAKVKSNGRPLEKAVIYYKGQDGNEYSAEAVELVENYAAFLFSGQGVLQDSFTKLEVYWDGMLHTADLMKMQSAPDTLVAQDNSPQVMAASESAEEAAVSGMVAEDSSQIEGALEYAASQAAQNGGMYRSRASSRSVEPRDGGNVIIVLDPGHGGSDPGACRTINGISYVESAITMQMGWAVKAELETYEGVTVYLTRAEDRYVTLKDRVDYAAALGATALVSLHINSTVDVQQNYATGALAFVPSGNYRPEQAYDTKILSEWILKELSEVGFKNNGLYKNLSETGDQYPNGSLADYYGIVRRSVLAGFPGMIIEHGFVNNPSDAATWYNDAGIAKIAQADAAGIAAYYGLQKKGTSGGNNGQNSGTSQGGSTSGSNTVPPSYSGPTGWQQTSEGWVYLKKDGSRTTGWLDDPGDGRTYYLNSSGIMLKGWQRINNIWCYFNEQSGYFQPEVKYIPEFQQGLTGWQSLNGVWYYLDGNSQAVTGWKKVNGRWYYMADNGVMQTGWQQVDGKWYYLNGSGAMQTGWQKIDGRWYYLNGSGARQTGWKQLGGKWYYMDGDGIMQTGWQQVDGKWYYLNGSGAMQTGWQKLDGRWYYLNGSGARQTGWKKLGGKWYYMDENGIMKTGWQQVEGIWYYMNGSGAMLTGWQRLGGKWYYLNGSGAMQTGWKKLGGKWYYMDENGIMKTGWQQVEGIWYYLNGNGAMLTGWQRLGGKWYYLNGSGAMQTGWLQLKGKRYYLRDSGAMLEKGTYLIDGQYYTFNSSGALI